MPWEDILQHIVLPALERSSDLAQLPSSPSSAAHCGLLQPRAHNTASNELPLPFTLQLLVRLLTQQASSLSLSLPPESPLPQPPSQQPAAGSPTTVAGAVVGKEAEEACAAGCGRGGAVGTAVLLALCGLLETRSPVADAATGQLLQATLLLQPLVAAHLAASPQVPCLSAGLRCAAVLLHPGVIHVHEELRQAAFLLQSHAFCLIVLYSPGIINRRLSKLQQSSGVGASGVFGSAVALQRKVYAV